LRTALLWVVSQQVVVISYGRFGATYLSHLKGSRIQRDSLGFLIPEVGRIGCPENSVRNYHYSLRNNSEERSSQLLRGGSLK